MSSHIYLSNHPIKVNMWREATTMGFNLLCDLKEVESIETHHTNLPHQQKDSQEPSHSSRNQPLGPTKFSDQLILILSHAMGIPASKGL